MTDYATLLRDHITLTCRSVDRIFLQGYVPKLQSVGWVCQFLRWQRGYRIPSSAAFGKIGKVYGVEVHLIADHTRLTKPGYGKEWRAQKARAGGGHHPAGGHPVAEGHQVPARGQGGRQHAAAAGEDHRRPETDQQVTE